MGRALVGWEDLECGVEGEEESVSRFPVVGAKEAVGSIKDDVWRGKMVRIVPCMVHGWPKRGEVPVDLLGATVRSTL